MRDLLQRVQRALPRVAEWIDELQAAHLPASAPASRVLVWARAGWFPSPVVDEARVVSVTKIPFPPVSDYGLPEFEAMAAMPMAGITFRSMYFVDEAQASDGVHFHELVHVIQWQTLGVRQFLSTYALGILQYGYAESPFEAMAYELQRRFESGVAPTALGGSVAHHANATRDAAARVYREHGLEMGA